MNILKQATFVLSLPLILSCSSEYVDPVSGMEFVKVKSGCFKMGYDRHNVCIDDDYYLGKFEVTQNQWSKLIGRNYSSYKSKYHPVEYVNIKKINEFIRRLNKKTGKYFRLPTEVEWEYACLSGGKNQKYCGSNVYSDVSWNIEENNDFKHHRVGLKQSNEFGLYDMTGNVSEWTSSKYNRSYQEDENVCATTAAPLMIRGGSWLNKREPLNASDRYPFCTDDASNDLGFRLLLEI